MTSAAQYDVEEEAMSPATLSNLGKEAMVPPNIRASSTTTSRRDRLPDTYGVQQLRSSTNREARINGTPYNLICAMAVRANTFGVQRPRSSSLREARSLSTYGAQRTT